MARRERISPMMKWLIIAIAICVDVLLFMFGIVAMIPIFGIIGTLLAESITLVWTSVLWVWFFVLGAGMGRTYERVKLILALQVAEVIVGMFPFVGGFLDLILTCINTVVLYLFIREIQKEDEEYNVREQEKLSHAK